MSTIASPRPSISSRRTSTSTDTTPYPDRGSQRRNRAALRDYYNLKGPQQAASDTPETPSTPLLPPEQESEIDKADFDANIYVSSLLSGESLANVLKVEAGLVTEIRSLDGEKKALVYDNYSKLIAATDTIKNMREKMDPLTPTTSTLTPAIGHIAQTATTLSRELRKSQKQSSAGDEEKERKRRQQQATVQWVLAAPERLQGLVENERRDEAEGEWTEVSALLNKWSGVRGVEDVRKACMAILENDEG